MRCTHSLRALLLSLTLLGCSQMAIPDAKSSPRVTELVSIVMAAPDSMPYLYGPAQAVLSNGSVLTEFGTSILRFDANGALIASFGREGKGPGEFVRVSAVITLPGDSLVAGVDARNQRISIFHVEDGALQREIRMPFRFFAGQQWRMHQGAVMMPVSLQEVPFVRWELATDAFAPWGRIPSVFGRSSVAYSRGGEPSLAPSGPRWVVQMPADNRLFITDSTGVAQSFVHLPRRARKGVPDDLLEQTAAMTDSTRTVLASISGGIKQLDDGSYLLVHVDTDYELVGEQVHYVNSVYWVSILSADFSRACVDEPIRFPTIDRARPLFAGDTLMLLARDVDDRGEQSTMLRRYMVSAEGCAWIDTGGLTTLDGSGGPRP